MYKGYKIIATTFAGREDRMSILVEYLVRALDLGIIDEYHVWDFASNENDRAWLKTLPKINNKIVLFEPDYSKYIPQSKWMPYYNHYVPENYSEKTVIIKIDDDIVYVDLEGLEKFIDFRIKNQHYFLVSGNVINNGVCVGLQQRYGAIPKEICPPDGFSYSPYCGELWDSGALAEKLHVYFLENRQRFLKNGFYSQPIRERISINFISFLGKDFWLTRQFKFDDEKFLSTQVGSSQGRINVVFYPMLVSHLSFCKQEKNINLPMLIKKYRDILVETISSRSMVIL
jgi:hypothetical protein